MGNIFSGAATDWGFNVADIWSSSMGIFVTLAVFVVLGIAVGFAPELTQLVRGAIIFKKYNEPWHRTEKGWGFVTWFEEYRANEYDKKYKRRGYYYMNQRQINKYERSIRFKPWRWNE